MFAQRAQPNDVEKAAKDRLNAGGYADLKQITCQYDHWNRTLTLRGRVSFFYLKQLAQETVRDIDTVHSVINAIEVAKKEFRHSCSTVD